MYISRLAFVWLNEEVDSFVRSFSSSSSSRVLFVCQCIVQIRHIINNIYTTRYDLMGRPVKTCVCSAAHTHTHIINIIFNLLLPIWIRWNLLCWTHGDKRILSCRHPSSIVHTTQRTCRPLSKTKEEHTDNDDNAVKAFLLLHTKKNVTKYPVFLLCTLVGRRGEAGRWGTTEMI